jgi:rod shape-determining protein MreD
MAYGQREPGIRPRRTVARMLDAAARGAAPLALCVLAILLLTEPVGIPGAAELLSGFLLASVFFWSVFWPAAMRPVPVFLLGLFGDLLGGTPLGLTPLLLLAIRMLAAGRREALAGFGFPMTWLAFSLLAAAAAAVQWALISLSQLHALPPAPALFEAALATAMYPLLSAGFTWAHRTIADPHQA